MATIWGTPGADTRSGTGGNDSMNGYEGDDSLSGLGGNDILEGGPGADTLDGGSGGDLHDVDSPRDLVLEAPDGGLDVVYSSVSFDVPQNVERLFFFGAGDFMSNGTSAADQITGAGGADTLTGLGGHDTLDGGAGNDSLSGGSGDDALSGSPGADTLAGGVGNDRYSIDDVLDVVLEKEGDGIDWINIVRYSIAVFHMPDHVENIYVGGGTVFGNDLSNLLEGSEVDERLFGGSGADTLLGAGFPDLLDGGGGPDHLSGGFGNDTLAGGPGADTIDGGADLDCVDYSQGTGGVAVDLGTGAAPDGDVLVAVEGVLGTVLADTLVGTMGFNLLAGAGGDDILSGDIGNDTLDGGEGIDAASYLIRAAGFFGVAVNLATGANTDGDRLLGIENLIGSRYDDTLIGNAGDNLLQGETSNDRLIGGDGRDWASYVSSGLGVLVDLAAGTAADGLEIAGAPAGTVGADTVEGIENIAGSATAGDTLRGDDLDNGLTGLGGDDVLEGRAGADTLIGGAGSDTLDGGTGADSLEGGAGDDHYVIDDPGDLIHERAPGGVDTVLASVDYRLAPSVERLALTSGAGNLIGWGNVLANVIEGNEGANRLGGGAGEDTIHGGEGPDRLVGGAGADLFILRPGAGRDVMVDFEPGVDRLCLEGFGALDFAWLEAHMRDRVAGLAIMLGGEDIAVLRHVWSDDVAAADFICA